MELSIILSCIFFLINTEIVANPDSEVYRQISQTANDCSEIGAVRYVQVFEIDKKLIVVWQAPESVELCGFNDLYYNVKYEGYVDVQDIVTQELHYDFLIDSYICAPGKITITPYDLTWGNGTEYSTYYNTEIPPVEDISAIRDNNTLLVYWSVPSDTDECNFTYSVTYTDTYQTITVWSNKTEIEMENMILKPCITGEISVSLYIGDSRASVGNQSIVVGIGPVMNYYLESHEGKVITTFDPPTDSELCNLTYQIIETDLECYRKEIEIHASETKNSLGASVWDEIETAIPAVSNLRAIINEDFLTVNWDPAFRANECNISYSIKYDNDEVFEQNSSLPSATLNVTFVPCYQASLEVSPISSTGLVGLSSFTLLQPPLGPVQNLQLNVTDGILKAFWDMPAYSQYCSLTYLLTIEESGIVHVYFTSITEYAFDFCTAVNLVINPLSVDGLTGPSQSISHSGNGCTRSLQN